MDYKRVLYVGGLAATVTEDHLKAAFITFGPIKALQIPKETIKANENSKKMIKKSRGFGYVEFDDAEDASEAKDNMDLSVIQNKVIRVDIAKKGSLKVGSTKPVWYDVNEWYNERIAQDEDDEDESNDFDEPNSKQMKT